MSPARTAAPTPLVALLVAMICYLRPTIILGYSNIIESAQAESTDLTQIHPQTAKIAFWKRSLILPSAELAKNHTHHTNCSTKLKPLPPITMPSEINKSKAAVGSTNGSDAPSKTKRGSRGGSTSRGRSVFFLGGAILVTRTAAPKTKPQNTVDSLPTDGSTNGRISWLLPTRRRQMIAPPIRPFHARCVNMRGLSR